MWSPFLHIKQVHSVQNDSSLYFRIFMFDVWQMSHIEIEIVKLKPEKKWTKKIENTK